MTFNRRVKQTVEHPYHGIIFSNKQDQTNDTFNLDKSQGNYAE